MNATTTKSRHNITFAGSVLLFLFGACGSPDGKEDSPHDYKSPDHHMGSRWDKVTLAELSGSESVQTLGPAIVKVGLGTGFYIGSLGGVNIVATNHHVCPREDACSQVSFDVLKRKFKVSQFIGTWPEIETTLLQIDAPSDGDQPALDELGTEFEFGHQLDAGTELFTGGYSLYENDDIELKIDASEDCIVHSKQGDFRQIADPDAINPLPYKTWSFALGCDAAHGDSGSPVADRATGKVVGILWTGRFPKAKRVQDSDYLRTIVGTDHADVWEQMNYAVPAFKIKEVLRQAKANESELAQKVITDLLN